ncbi:MAG TPA: hypothetical protein VLG44_00505 [Chlamydiales bacterium]|nr:hypothetical protein [Chlamydiales bacterium]
MSAPDAVYFRSSANTPCIVDCISNALQSIKAKISSCWSSSSTSRDESTAYMQLGSHVGDERAVTPPDQAMKIEHQRKIQSLKAQIQEKITSLDEHTALSWLKRNFPSENWQDLTEAASGIPHYRLRN